MTRYLKKQLRIVYERIKVPRRLLKLLLHLSGQYRRGVRNAHDIQLQQLDVSLERLPTAFDGFRIIVLADLHIDSELHLLPRIKRILADLHGDALVFLGDYRHRLHGSHNLVIKRMRNILQARENKDCTYAVRGNHDSRDLMYELSTCGVRVLNNESVVFHRNGDSIYLAGVDEPHYDKADDLPLALTDVPRHACKILLAHTAEIYKEAEELGVDLYLCGHTHGGQINIKGIGPIITNVNVPRRFARGFWTWKRMIGYTTAGVGTSAVPVRFNCPPEIVLLTLRKKSNVDEN